MPERFVFDSFALLAYFLDEAGASRVEALLERASEGECELSISVVNLGEVIYTIENRQGRDSAIAAAGLINQLPITAIDIGRSLALRAARIKAEFGMGDLDCFVAALGQELDATVLTGDRDFEKISDHLAIEWLPGSVSI